MKLHLRDFFLLTAVIAIHFAARGQIFLEGIPPVVCLSACVAWNALRIQRSEMLAGVLVGALTSGVSSFLIVLDVARELQGTDYWSWDRDWLRAIIIVAIYLAIGAVIGGAANFALRAVFPAASQEN